MNDMQDVSRRERQIMDIVFARGEATVLEIQSQLPNAPSPMAIRRMLGILEEKGHLKRRKEGRQHVYSPKQARTRAARTALNHVLNTFFEGSVGNALASHLADPRNGLGEEELAELSQLIEQARQQGR